MTKAELENQVAGLKKLVASGSPSQELEKKVEALASLVTEQEQRIERLTDHINRLRLAGGRLLAVTEDAYRVLENIGGYAAQIQKTPTARQRHDMLLATIQRCRSQFRREQ